MSFAFSLSSHSQQSTFKKNKIKGLSVFQTHKSKKIC